MDTFPDLGSLTDQELKELIKQLTEEEMDQLAGAATPIIKIRDNWTVVDPAMLKRAKRRMIRTVQPAAALAATLTNVVQVEEVAHEAIVGASLLKVRDRLQERLEAAEGREDAASD